MILFPQLSVRARLALWHTTILAALLTGSAMVSVFLLRRTTASTTDTELIDSAGAFTSELFAERRELPTLRLAVTEALNNFSFNDVAVAVFDSAGRMMGEKPFAGPKIVSAMPFDATRIPAAVGRRFGSGQSFLTIPDPEGGVRVFALPVTMRRERVMVSVARSLHQDAEALEEAGAGFALIAPLVLLLAGAAGWFLAGRSLSPVGAMSARAERISASTTSERLPVANPRDELGRLAIVLNDLLDRLAEALAQQRRFMTDASHELRTPVAVVRAVADVVLSKAQRSETDYRDALETVHREARRLSRVVDDLFLLSRADIGERPLRRASLYLDEVISDSARDLGALAVQKGIRVECRLPEDGAPFEGDEELLDRVFGNLLDNAIKYGPERSRVIVTLVDQGAVYSASVEDEGPGVPENLRERIFERFFRATDDDFSVPGAGLGLSIARWVVEAHDGAITVEESVGGGARFTIVLPKNGNGEAGVEGENASIEVTLS